jgi:hypothetical protein
VDLSHTDLLLIWFAGGFVVCLAWAAILGQVLIGERRTAVPPAVATLAVVGLLNPLAALGATDLVRLSRTLDEPEVALPRWAFAATTALGAAGVVVATALWAAGSSVT